MNEHPYQPSGELAPTWRETGSHLSPIAPTNLTASLPLVEITEVPAITGNQKSAITWFANRFPCAIAVGGTPFAGRSVVNPKVESFAVDRLTGNQSRRTPKRQRTLPGFQCSSPSAGQSARAAGPDLELRPAKRQLAFCWAN